MRYTDHNIKEWDFREVVNPLDLASDEGRFVNDPDRSDLTWSETEKSIIAEASAVGALPPSGRLRIDDIERQLDRDTVTEVNDPRRCPAEESREWLADERRLKAAHGAAERILHRLKARQPTTSGARHERSAS